MRVNKNATIRSMFYSVFNGAVNFMTPTIEDYIRKGNLIIEISRGKGLFTPRIYGVTVLKVTEIEAFLQEDGNYYEVEKTELNSGGFSTRFEADQYIETLEG